VNPLNPEATPTIRQVLTHTFGSAENLAYLYQPERYEALRPMIEACTGLPFRDAVTDLLDAVAMNDTVPGPDAIFVPPPAPDPLDPDADLRHAATIARYVFVLDRLATPYAVDPRGSATRSQYLAATLTASNGLVSTARDMARFHLALRNGLVINAETLAAAWQAPLAASQQPLPHASGWFSQNYRGHAVVWQFGVSDGASSSLMLSLPARGLTLVMLANSDGLVRPFPLSNGDITVSPFGRVFLGLFVP
jgi:CubicO group peptidase (beta-lactamase class C family)